MSTAEERETRRQQLIAEVSKALWQHGAQVFKAGGGDDLDGWPTDEFDCCAAIAVDVVLAESPAQHPHMGSIHVYPSTATAYTPLQVRVESQQGAGGEPKPLRIEKDYPVSTVRAADVVRTPRSSTFRAHDAPPAQGPVEPLTLTPLEVLPVGSVVLDREGDSWQLYSHGWVMAGGSVAHPNTSAGLMETCGPVRLLWTGQQ